MHPKVCGREERKLTPSERRVRVRVRRPRGRVVPLVGLALAGSAPAAAASGPGPRPTATVDAPWNRARPAFEPPSVEAEARPFGTEAADGTFVPPPAKSASARGPEARMGAPGVAPPSASPRRAPRAVHPEGSAEGRKRLFPRAGKTYEVREGDTLWSIAARRLGTDDVARIARYWPRIHRANREVIGADPNLIYAGQRLFLPTE